MIIYLINDRWGERLTNCFSLKTVDLPVKGVEYTIKNVIIINDNYYLLLNEINNIMEPDVCFHYSRFSQEKPEGDMVNVLDFETVREIYKSQINVT